MRIIEALVARFRVPWRFFSIVAAIALLHTGIFFTIATVVSVQGGNIEHIIYTQDEGEYIEIAQSLLASGEFRIDGGIETETFRTVGYPLFVVFVLSITGGWFWSIFLIHTLFIGLTAGIIAWIAEMIGIPRKKSMIAAVLFGISSGPILLTVSGMGSDKLFPVFYALAAGLILTLTSDTAYKRAALIGLLLGIATLVRPIGILASIPVMIGLIFVPGHDVFPSIKKRLVVAGVALLVFLATLTPWCIRNYVVAGHFSLSSLPLYNFVYYNMPMFLSTWNNTSEEAERDFILEKLGNPNLMTLRGYTYSDAMGDLQKEFLRENWMEYGIFHVYKMIPFFLGSGFNVAHAVIAAEAPSLRLPFFPTEQDNLTSAVLKGDWKTVADNIFHYPLVTVERMLWILIFAFAFIAPLLAKGYIQRFLLLSCVIILSFAFLSSPVIQPRYRVPAEPFIWIAATYSVYRLYRWRVAPEDSTLAS